MEMGRCPWIGVGCLLLLWRYAQDLQKNKEGPPVGQCLSGDFQEKMRFMLSSSSQGKDSWKWL